jgi:hypothetical protein
MALARYVARWQLTSGEGCNTLGRRIGFRGEVRRLMTTSSLERLIWRHNAACLAAGIALAVGGLVFWWLSFWIFRWLFLILTYLLGYRGLWNMSFYVAAGGTLLLLIEGVRYRRDMVGLKDYQTSMYFDNFLTYRTMGPDLNFYRTNPLGIAYIISQTLFCAPRTTVQAIEWLRGFTRGKPAIVETATRIYNRLDEEDAWMPVSIFPGDGAALCLLDRLRLIWTDCKDDVVTVRIPPTSWPLSRPSP